MRLAILCFTLVPIILASGATPSPKCLDVSPTCGGENAECTMNATLFYNTSNPADYFIECRPPAGLATAKCCKQGLFCIEGACRQNNIGAACTTKANCYPGEGVTAPYDCWKGFCKVFGLENDDCQAHEDCWVDMECSDDNRCLGFKKGDRCLSDGECTFGLYCSTAENQCETSSDAGEVCKEPDSPCIVGTFCDTTQKLCQYEYTQIEDETCDVANPHACAPGFACDTTYNPDNTLGKCVPADTTLKSCTSDADCSEGNTCICRGNGELRCTSFHYAVCQTQYKDWRTCLGDSHCGDSYMPGTCAYRNCGTQYTELANCMCDDWKIRFGTGCNFNWCSKPIAFKPLQIGIIVVIVIMAVILIVTVGFFIVRQCATNDSLYAHSVELDARGEAKKEEDRFVALED